MIVDEIYRHRPDILAATTWLCLLYTSEAGNILESDQRNVKAVAETDKTGSLVTGVNVKDAGDVYKRQGMYV